MTLVVSPRPAYVEFRIASEGARLALDARRKMFAPRATGVQERGFGLTDCRLVAEAHGGTFWITETANGAVACLTLPTAAAPSRPAPARSKSGTHLRAGHSGPAATPQTILVVDDEPLIRTFLSRGCRANHAMLARARSATLLERQSGLWPSNCFPNASDAMLIQELNLEECRLVLAEARFGRLACVRDAQPYVIPIYFAVDEAYVYAFSLVGQKLEWMRDNPRVCLEVDNLSGSSDWTSVVVLGRYEELPDTLEYRSPRGRAHDLWQDRPMWWEPGTIPVADRLKSADLTPIYYRISMEHVTGRRGAPSPEGP